jgi:hypothetical protein
MILIGICRQPACMQGAVAVVEASLKRGQKRYVLFRYDDRLSAEPDMFFQGVLSCLADRGLRRAKRLFSQDRRPKKTVTDPPRAVAFEDGSRLVEALRDRGVMVEAVRFSPVKKWKKHLVGKALGADYTVDPRTIVTCAVRVFEEGRIGSAGQPVDRLFGGPAAMSSAPLEEAPALAVAVALPLWFRETVPYRRAYRAN